MNDLHQSNSQIVSLQKVLEILEKAPNSDEILDAVDDLRREKIKQATAETINVVQFNRSQVVGEWIAEKQSTATKRTYIRELQRFFSFSNRKGLHVLQVRRADLIRLRDELKEKYSINTTRLCLSTVSAFYRYLEAERYIEHNPAISIPYPRREYKKAVMANPGETIPVMNEAEYQQIIQALERQRVAEGTHISALRRRESAARLLPAVRFMALFGLRVGDLPTVKVDREGFSYRAKGGVILRRKKLESWDEAAAGRLCESLKREPFGELRPATVQIRLKAVTARLTDEERLRYPYTAHDLRHPFARRVYERGRDVYQVSRFLGHSSVATTQVYLQQIGLIYK